MCRLLGYVSDVDTDFESIVGPAFTEFAQLSSLHCDGWGMTTKGGIIKEPTQANKSTHFMETVKGSKSDASLLHLRWASKGLAVQGSNNHPFELHGISFIHNGSFQPVDALDSILKYRAKLLGTTDSERYFLLLVEKVEELGLEKGLQETVATIRTRASYASLNAMVLTPEKYVVVCEYDLTKKPENLEDSYYELRYTDDGHSIIAGSSGWDQKGWTLIPNHTALIIDRKTRAIETIAL